MFIEPELLIAIIEETKKPKLRVIEGGKYGEERIYRPMDR